MRVHIIVHGILQGVGYRSLVKHVADRYGVKGVVKNLPDGSVEVFAESEKASLEDFIAGIHVNKEGGPDVFYMEKSFDDKGFLGKDHDPFRIEHD